MSHSHVLFLRMNNQMETINSSHSYARLQNWESHFNLKMCLKKFQIFFLVFAFCILQNCGSSKIHFRETDEYFETSADLSASNFVSKN